MTKTGDTERRLIAIFAADVEGYSRLMGADEVGTLRDLTQRRDILDSLIASRRGRIANTAGDSVLAEFGSAVDAVQCAVEAQAALSQANVGLSPDRHINFRIGVHVGDVMIKGGDLFGDGVNIAARLQTLASAGGVCLSGVAYDQVRKILPFGFADLGAQQVKNIDEPVRAFSVVAERAAVVTASENASVPLALPDKPSIAVLPFVNISSDPEQAFFADGLTEDLITDLSKVPGFLVIARNSSFAYTGRSGDIRSIARELNVRYLIEGSVRRASARVRINAQLVDATTGNHLWAERYDRDLADIFRVQDDVVGKIVSALAGTLPSARGRPPRRTTNLEAYDLFARGRSLAMLSLQDTSAARPLLGKAIELDPGFVEAHAWLAMSHHFGWMYLGEPKEEHRMLARLAARQAISLDPANADAHIVHGYLRAYEGELSEGSAEVEIGLRVNPNHADGWIALADLRVCESRAAQGIDCAANAFRLNPHPPDSYHWWLGWIQYAARRYEDAVETLRDKSARAPVSRRTLAAALAQLERMTEAREEARKFLVEFPHFSAKQWGRTVPFCNEADRQHFIDGYVKAGLPE